MYDLHCHSLLGDGQLLPSEVAARYQAAGYKAIAITDHADYSNIEQLTASILNFTKNWPKDALIKVFPGVELTHLPLVQFKPLAALARKKGMKIIIGHGETVNEPVVKGTNRAALEADIDILAHPGLITKEDAEFAKKRGILLEITTRLGHRDTNQHVVEMALKTGAKLILNNDSHSPQDILSAQQMREFGLRTGFTEAEIVSLYKGVERLLTS